MHSRSQQMFKMTADNIDCVTNMSLLKAVQNNDYDEIYSIMKGLCKYNERDDEGSTLIHIAVRQQKPSYKIISLLIKSDLIYVPNSLDEFNMTPLDYLNYRDDISSELFEQIHQILTDSGDFEID